ncbi:SusE domain-containing protein [Mucilaginibacter sp.]|uniref:SusE domain-containing protein n=1 Tax=Mucilaginibacter sp. TaxID=1882438 RepID=UPI0028454B95|nr:SusE domain-containing protein [Mucilaginibacter sp.]MDR3694832.1 SusE domain-containing protein [Mucilaginibacter sp.]
MKKVLSKFIALSSIGLLMLSACKKDGTLVTSNGGKAGTLTASVTTLVLDKTKLYDTTSIINFGFTAANYGFSAAVTNTLQIDAANDNWANPASVTLSNKVYNQGYSTGVFNALLLKLNLVAGVTSTVNVRVAHTISTSVTPVYSNVVALSVTPFNLITYLWVPGAYQGWSPSTAGQLTSPTDNNIYSGIINFTGTDLSFKITSEADWNGTNYGAGATAGTLSSTGGNLTAPADGGFLVGVNLTTNTITYTPQWSIIGDATPGGWGTDTDMLFDSTNNTWYVTAKLVSDGTNAIKFRFNNAWAVNLGGSGGTLTSGGSNITIPSTGAGGANYLITLDPVANTYTLVKQ